MQISDLIVIGRLGNIIDVKDEFLFKPNNNFQPVLFEEFEDIFLIIENDSVRYGYFDWREDENKFYVSFSDYFINKAVNGAMRVLLAFAPDDYDSIIEDENSDDYDKFEIYYNSEIIGKLESTMYNGEYEVLIIRLKSGKEFLVPFIDEFVSNYDKDNNKIFLKNIEELLEL